MVLQASQSFCLLGVCSEVPTKGAWYHNSWGDLVQKHIQRQPACPQNVLKTWQPWPHLPTYPCPTQGCTTSKWWFTDIWSSETKTTRPTLPFTPLSSVGPAHKTVCACGGGIQLQAQLKLFIRAEWAKLECTRSYGQAVQTVVFSFQYLRW